MTAAVCCSSMKVIDVPHPVDSAMELCYDPDWLVITKATNSMFPNTKRHWVAPSYEQKYVGMYLWLCVLCNHDMCCVACTELFQKW